MSINTFLTSAAVSLSIAAGSLIPLAGSAQADDWRYRDGYRRNGEYAYRYNNPAPRWNRYASQKRFAYKKHHDNDHDRHNGRNVMIGLTALAIAAIIASSAEREHRR